MASTGSGRGPIKVGSGYIDVFPKLNQEQLRKTRSEIEKQMGATGKKAGKAFSEGITTQIATIPKKAAEASAKAQKAIQRGAEDSKKVLKRIEKEITAAYGKEAGQRFRDAAELEKKKQKLLENTSAATRRAVQATVREEQEAARTAAKTWETAEKERLRLIREREREAQRAAQQQVQAERRAQQQIREELRRTITEMRRARLQELQTQMDAQRDQARMLRTQLQGYRRQMDDHTRAVGRGLTGLQAGWRRQGEAIEKLGTNITETGRLVSTNLLAPLGAVSSILTAIGVQSADMRVLGQMGLTAAGVSKGTSAKEMKRIQQYAIATPFSIDTMHEYQMKMIRDISGNDKEWYKKGTRTKAANRAAAKTSDIIMAVGDTMSRAGNLDQGMFERAMYAVNRMSGMDKAATRTINQLVDATGIPAGELAQMFGFKNAGAFWKVVGTPVAKGGGVSGQDMINNLLQHWDPNYFKMGKNGKRMVDPKTGQPIINPNAHSSAGGSRGFGEKMTSATITGRIQQLKEQAQFSLGSLFAKENSKTHEYEYTSLGESIMGKKKTDKQKYITVGYGAHGEPITKKNPNYGKTSYEGGLLQDIQKLGKDQKGNIITLLKTFFDAVGTFTKQIQAVSDWLKAHPKVKEAFAGLVKMAAAVAPFVLALGIATKVFGKMTKLVSSALTPLKNAFKGIRGATRVGRQVAAGIQSRRSGNGFFQGYRDRRTQLRGGDTRGPIARTRDRVTGRDSTLNNLRGQIRSTEDAIRQTEESITSLQRQIREVNRVSIRQLVDQFAGSSAGSGGSGNLQGSAHNAGRSVTDLDDLLQRLNRQKLNSLVSEFTDLKDKVEKATKEIGNTEHAVTKLNDKKLTALKVSVDSAHGTVTDLKNKIDDTSHSVGQLNGKKLGTLRAGQIETTKNQAEKLKTSVSHATKEVGTLNGKKLTAVRKQINDTTSAGDRLSKKIKEVIGRVTDLNGKSLSSIRDKFKSLHNAVNEVYKKLGTRNSGVNGRVVDLNGRSLGSIIRSVKNLKDALKDAGDKAGVLNTRLDSISRHAPGRGGSGGGSSKGKKGKHATGGILPGYTPGRDVHVFQSPTAGTLELSGGEAVMRPEFTAALGPEAVNRLNAIARAQGIHGVRKAMKFARGGVLDKLGLRSLIDNVKNFSIGGDVLGALSTMTMDSSSRAIGGDSQRGVVGSGTDGAHFIGADTGRRFEGIYKFMSRDSWDILKKLPIPDGYTQAIGAVGGAVAPVAGEYFWNDVWKGRGNILERGGRFMNDLISLKTLKKVVSGFFSGAWDSVKSVVSGGMDFLSDPTKFLKDSVSGVWELVRSEYDGVIDMVKSLREIWHSPKDYAKQVIGDIYTTAKDSLPNLEGLFDFSGDHLSSKGPDISKLIDAQLSAPGVGGSVKRWTPQVKMALAQLGLPQSALDLVLHRIQVESGGNPHAINNWDSNAKAGHPSQGLMQTIPSTFNAYAGPYRSRGIFDPMASIYAGLNYAKHRYGSGWMKALSGNKGYAKGTDGAAPGWAWVGEEGPELVKFSGGETVLNARDSAVAGRKVAKGYAKGTENSGLYKAVIGTTSQLNSAFSKLRDLLSKAFSADLISKSKHGSLSKWLEKENKELSKLASKRSDIASKIKDANAKLADLKNQSAEMAKNISSQASGGNPLADAFNSGEGVTATSALHGLQARLKAINAFKDNLKALTKKGYSQAIIQEVANAGLQQGNEMAKALLSASSSQVKDISKTYDKIFKASDSLGKSVADQYYKAGEASTNALLKGLKAKEKDLLKGISSMVGKMISHLTKELKAGKGKAVRSDIASILTWLMGSSQPAKSSSSKKKSSKKKTTKKKGKGYWTGTLSASPGVRLVGERGPELVDFRGGERVYNNRDTSSMLGRKYEIHIHEAKHENTTQATIRALQYIDTMYG